MPQRPTMGPYPTFALTMGTVTEVLKPLSTEDDLLASRIVF